MKRPTAACLALLLLVAPIARADTDYVCLKACISEGESQGVCLPKCAYNIPETPPPDVTAKLNRTCLTSCMQDSNAVTTECFPKCTNLIKPQVTDAGPRPADTVAKAGKARLTQDAEHNALEAPTPVEGLLLTPKKPVTERKETDMSCNTACIRSHFSSGFCSERCVKDKGDDLPPGSAH